MATTPGILTNWPWEPLGCLKYAILAPWAIHSTYSWLFNKESRNLFYFLVFPLLLLRALNNFLWISYSRYRTAKGRSRIVDKGIDFEQVDRESNWDDQIIFSGVVLYVVYWLWSPLLVDFPVWNTRGVIETMLLHAGPVEFLYYWLHRALHHHYLYSRYHSHHHSSIVTEPITSVTHPFAEHLAYFSLFAFPLLTTVFNGTASVASIAGYITYIDFMNNMGHCNFEFVPPSLFVLLPPLKFLVYTPSYHSLHHTRFRTNFSLFMPFYDYVYDTVDESSDSLQESSLKRDEESPDAVNLVHLTSSLSVYHLPIGIATFASKPFTSKWYLGFAWPFTTVMGFLLSTFLSPFTIERFIFKGHKFQSWVVPRFTEHYLTGWQNSDINGMIEDAIMEAEKKGVKVMSLGMMNQGEEMNKSGYLYVQKMPDMNLRLVDGSSLAVAVILNAIPQGTTEVLLCGHSNKISRRVASDLIKRGVQVTILKKVESQERDNIYGPKVWLVGEGLSDEDQMKAKIGTMFIPFSQFPPRILRRGCFYCSTPAMTVPQEFENLNACENWLPRNVMSAWRIAGIMHAIEAWKEHEVGSSMLDVDMVWEAALRLGFRPLNMPLSIP